MKGCWPVSASLGGDHFFLPQVVSGEGREGQEVEEAQLLQLH